MFINPMPITHMPLPQGSINHITNHLLHMDTLCACACMCMCVGGCVSLQACVHVWGVCAYVHVCVYVCCVVFENEVGP